MTATADLLKLIRERQSTRVSFDPRRRVGRRSLGQIIEAARWAPTPHNMQNFEITVVDDPDLLRQLGKIKSTVSEEFLRENYRQLSFSEEELRRKGAGVLGTMFPPSWRDLKKLQASPAPLNQSINGSPALLIVTYDPRRRAPASEGDFLGIIGLGCVMENMWLTAQSLGIGFQILSVFGGGPVEKEAKRILAIPKEMKIAFAVRLGYPVRTRKYLRVRRDARALVHHNRYRATTTTGPARGALMSF